LVAVVGDLPRLRQPLSLLLEFLWVRRLLLLLKARRLLLLRPIRYHLLRFRVRSNLGRSGFARMALKAIIGRMGTSSIDSKIARIGLLLQLMFRTMW
jgi:hypothetical protein